jgi:flagellar biosynthetic protein FlhB
MTPQEVEDEEKQREGDPEIQERQQERMREMSERRMMEEVPEPDVVITNPTHYAVSLRFVEERMDAPKLTAKGKEMQVKRIKSLAREYDVPVYEVPLLARALFQLELDEEIPPSLYEAVAEVLAWVFKNQDDVDESMTANVEQMVKETEYAP